MMKRILVIFQKELLDNLRDTRSWTTGLFWAMFGPIMLGGMIMLLGNTIREKVEESLVLPVAGAENAPNLIAFLEQQDVVVQPAPADPEAAVIAGDINVALIIPADYGENFSAGETSTVQLVFDSTRQSAMADISRAQSLLENYSSYIGLLRLSLRGVSPEVMRPVQVEEVDTATPQSQALIFLSMLPYFIIFAIFNGASPVITDATAGERERGSLEPLLINPLPRGWVAVGKMISAMPFAIFNLTITLAGFAAVFRLLPMEELLGVQIGFDLGALLSVFLVCLPIVVLACAIQTLIASYAKTTKEAGTYLPFIGLIPSLPGLALAFLPVKPDLWTMLIPTFGQQILINQFLRAEPITGSNIFISAAMTLLLAMVITYIAIKLYEGERIIKG
ncbi:MAG TPA: ABC transporter permease [Anaerolineales bacterium]|nr:ABC transporter permease [Anaerolineales bacterium]HNO85074.1 ABC transporter permease [Anaerolineales bacterium]